MQKEELITMLLEAGFESLCGSNTFLKDVDDGFSVLLKLEDACTMILDIKGYSCRQKVDYSELIFDKDRKLLMTSKEYDSMVCPLSTN